VTGRRRIKDKMLYNPLIEGFYLFIFIFIFDIKGAFFIVGSLPPKNF
jgi:hypothetical protein